MDKIRIILSFDHELSLGGGRSYSDDLFDPTNQLLDCAREVGVPIALFTDVLCAMRFKEWDEEGFFTPYREQIKRAILENHDVQLHLHPHWVDSNYENGEFIPAKTFAFGNFSDRDYPDNIPGIIKRGFDFLNELCRGVYKGYKCVAYRAGGFNLVPETASILSPLYDNGIRIDSSIIKGYYFKSDISEVDYHEMPTKANWYIPISGPINQQASSGIYEIPIASRSRTLIKSIPFLLKSERFTSKNKRRQRRNVGPVMHLHSKKSTSKRIKHLLFPRTAWDLNFDSYLYSVRDLMKIMNYHIKKHHRDEEIIFSTISHPKNMGEYSFYLMRNFIDQVRKRFKDKVTFCTYRQIYDEIGLDKS
jgi:hypothetical protein